MMSYSQRNGYPTLPRYGTDIIATHYKGDSVVKTLFGTLFLLLVSAQIAFGQCSEADKKALEAFDHGWTEANARGDRAYLENIYADDYAGISLVGPPNKKEIIDAAIRAAERDKANPQNASKVTADHFMIACTPTSATITHRNVIRSMVGGREQTSYARGVHFLEKRNGRWQIVSLANHPLDDATNLRFMEEEWNDANRKKDVSWFEHNLASDFTFVNFQTGALQNKDEWLNNIRNRTSTFDTIETADLRTRVSDDLGLLTGVVHVKGRDDKSQPLNYSLRFTVTYIKRDGRWLAQAAHATRVQ
jgi:ketosteroid isomerase-like protein